MDDVFLFLTIIEQLSYYCDALALTTIINTNGKASTTILFLSLYPLPYSLSTLLSLARKHFTLAQKARRYYQKALLSQPNPAREAFNQAVNVTRSETPREVMEEVAAAGDLELLDLWVEDEFGFPWILNHAGQMSFMPVEDYYRWCNEV